MCGHLTVWIFWTKIHTRSKCWWVHSNRLPSCKWVMKCNKQLITRNTPTKNILLHINKVMTQTISLVSFFIIMLSYLKLFPILEARKTIFEKKKSISGIEEFGGFSQFQFKISTGKNIQYIYQGFIYLFKRSARKRKVPTEK